MSNKIPRNPIDVQCDVQTVLGDVIAARQTEEASLAYEEYLAGDDINDPDVSQCQDNINRLRALEDQLAWYSLTWFHGTK